MHIGEVGMTLMCSSIYSLLVAVSTSQALLRSHSDEKNICGGERHKRLAKMGLLTENEQGVYLQVKNEFHQLDNSS